MDLRPVALTIGYLLLVLSLAMLAPAALDFFERDRDSLAFLGSAAITFFFGVAMILINRGSGSRMDIRQGFILTASIWVMVALFGALPFIFSHKQLGITDALFESTSGITTTGATVITGLDELPRGLLLWRALLQWLGGVGIVVTAISILPFLRVGGMQLFKTEAFEQSEKFQARATAISLSIVTIYLGLTLLFIVLLRIAGMGWFDAICHAMTSIATGGFSTHDASIGYFDSSAIEWIVILAMICGSLPFVLLYKQIRGQHLVLFRDEQVQGFLWLLGLSVLIVVGYRGIALYLGNQPLAPLSLLRETTFNVTSVFTGTGYSSENYSLWGGFSQLIFFAIMFLGGCAGSTSCGLKIFRVQVLYGQARVQLARLLHPNGVFLQTYNGAKLDDPVVNSVVAFFFLYVGTFTVASLLLAMTGLDLVTVLTGAGSAIANVGPGLGEMIGPGGNFQELNGFAKLVLAATMLLGRLEIFTFMVFLLPSFWRG